MVGDIPFLTGTSCFSLLHAVVLVNINLLTPWSRVPLEKLTGFQLVKKFPAFTAVAVNVQQDLNFPVLITSIATYSF